MHAIESDSFRPRPRARESDFYSRTRDEYEHEDDDEGGSQRAKAAHLTSAIDSAAFDLSSGRK